MQIIWEINYFKQPLNFCNLQFQFRCYSFEVTGQKLLKLSLNKEVIRHLAVIDFNLKNIKGKKTR